MKEVVATGEYVEAYINIVTGCTCSEFPEVTSSDGELVSKVGAREEVVVAVNNEAKVGMTSSDRELPGLRVTSGDREEVETKSSEIVAKSEKRDMLELSMSTTVEVYANS